jgi:hypothetical protein
VAVGDAILFNAALHYLAGTVDIRKATGWRAGITTATFGALTAGLSAPRFGEAPLLEVTAGGHYPAGGIVLTTEESSLSAVEASAQTSLALNLVAHPDGILELSATGGNPGAVRTMVIYDADASDSAAILAIDLTSDGVTPGNLAFRRISLTINPTGTRGVFLTLQGT